MRDDTIGRNSFYRNKLLHNRCVIIADGFYEWKLPLGYAKPERGERLPKGVRKIPYRIVRKGLDFFPLSGLWRTIEPRPGEPLLTTGIITTRPNDVMKPIHDRMPVILSDADLETWLDGSVQDFESLHPLLAPFPSEQIEAYQVSEVVNSSRNETPDCIKAVSS